MTLRLTAVALALAGLVPVAPARADKAPVIVIPSRPGIPTAINGRNANYAVVEGDWGLSRPGHMPQTVIGGSPIYPTRDYAPRGRYFPVYGSRPSRGRYEIEPGPDRPMPEPAEPFSRSWSSHSQSPPPMPRAAQRGPAPAFDSDPQDRALQFSTPPDVVPPTIENPNAINPPVVVIPQTRRWRP